jgi:hypothetical protein
MSEVWGFDLNTNREQRKPKGVAVAAAADLRAYLLIPSMGHSRRLVWNGDKGSVGVRSRARSSSMHEPTVILFPHFTSRDRMDYNS